MQKHSISNFPFISNEQVIKELEESLPRITKAYAELFSGYNLCGKDVLNNVIEVENYSGVVTVNNINFYTFCKHHFLPFFGTASISYEPGKIITGLGKIIRLVKDVHARRLQIQETMAMDIADDIMNVLAAKGVFVELKAKHLCTCSRGPSDDTSETVVQYGCGTLQKTSLKG